ncbi:antitoxin [Ectopseudomonas mendocina]|nr:antitoxin [Pseudomonas mendocina]TRO11768.1 antitoxin [Pseudomonas mendocina]TRO19814.1 antitoxin [Pseudomonas mendocina]
MSAQLSPIVSEFSTEAEAASYDRWYRRKVEASLADQRPCVAHDQVMSEAATIIEAAEKKIARSRS